jgi:hypothetical protein
MSREKTSIPDDLRHLCERLEEWRSVNPPKTRLPESMWVAAVEMAQRHGLHRTTKALRMDYTRLKNRLPAGAERPKRTSPAFLELLTPIRGPGEYVVELESGCGRMRVAMKGMSLDWASLLHAWRETER